MYPHMLRLAFVMAALDAGVPLRDVQIAARHADPRTTTIYDRRHENFDRHAAYVAVAYVAPASSRARERLGPGLMGYLDGIPGRRDSGARVRGMPRGRARVVSRAISFSGFG